MLCQLYSKTFGVTVKATRVKEEENRHFCLIDGLLKVMESLIFLLFLFVLVDLEVAQLVALLGVRHDPQPVPEVVLLQVLLGQVLQVPARNTGRRRKKTEEMLIT